MPKPKPTTIDLCDVRCIHPETVAAIRTTLVSTEEAQELAALFTLLADPTRVRLLHALSHDELCVCDLANVLGLRQAAVSQQLRLLRAQGIVRVRKEGQMAFYTLNDTPVTRPLIANIDALRGASGTNGTDERHGERARA